MGWLSRRRAARSGRGAKTPTPKQQRRAALVAAERHLADFVRSRRGVEMWVEPATRYAEPSVLLVAYDGEWTRRKVESVTWGRKFAHEQRIPCYDAGVVGYPQRMRDWNARQRER